MEVYEVTVHDSLAVEWHQNGELHRLDGPAVTNYRGAGEYWIEGEQLTEEEFRARTKPCLSKKIIVDGIEYTLY